MVNLEEGFWEEMGLLTGIAEGEIYRKADLDVREQKKLENDRNRSHEIILAKEVSAESAMMIPKEGLPVMMEILE